MTSRRRAAFTLIELLIVVAIIAILASIAVPNFLEAQTRAKVSRAKSDLRTLAGAIEQYTADFGRPPFDGIAREPHYGWVDAQKRMTTPVAYISSVPADIFSDASIGEALRPGHTNFVRSGRPAYDYATFAWQEGDIDPISALGWARNVGPSAWKLGSAGPDAEWVNDGSFYGLSQIYDPTNGTVSLGDLVRSQSRSE